MSLSKYCHRCGCSLKGHSQIRALRDQAQSMFESTRWFQWGYRKELKGFLVACSKILGE